MAPPRRRGDAVEDHRPVRRQPRQDVHRRRGRPPARARAAHGAAGSGRDAAPIARGRTRRDAARVRPARGGVAPPGGLPHLQRRASPLGRAVRRSRGAVRRGAAEQRQSLGARRTRAPRSPRSGSLPRPRRSGTRACASTAARSPARRRRSIAPRSRWRPDGSTRPTVCSDACSAPPRRGSAPASAQRGARLVARRRRGRTGGPARGRCDLPGPRRRGGCRWCLPTCSESAGAAGRDAAIARCRSLRAALRGNCSSWLFTWYDPAGTMHAFAHARPQDLLLALERIERLGGRG